MCNMIGVLGRVYAIAINTFREAVRDRVLQGVVAAATAVLVFSLALAELSLDQESRVVYDVGLAAISLFGVIVAIFLGSSLLYKEIERKTLYVILPKPVRRSEFVVGKFAGIGLTGSVFVGTTGGLALWLLALEERHTPVATIAVPPAFVVLSLALALWKLRGRTTVLVPWTVAFLALSAWCATWAGVDPWPVLHSLALVAGEIAILTAVALVFSSFSSPFLTGVLTGGVWLVGRSAETLATMKSKMVPDEIKLLLRGVAEVAPNLHLFVPGRHTLTTVAPRWGGPWLYVGETLGYGAAYCVVLLAVASLIFRRRDFL